MCRRPHVIVRQVVFSLCFLLACGTFVLRDAHAAEIVVDDNWTRIKLDETFRAEGVATGDFNHDGLMDVAAGDYWYAAPDWKKHEVRPVGEYKWNGSYSQCFVEFAHDISGDGWDDLIIVGFPGDPFSWYENPQNAEGHWKKHEIWTSACNETVLFTDITGDGKPELVLGSQPERQMGYLEIPPADKIRERWKFIPISEPGDPAQNGTFKYYHGLGAGDFNGDGRADVLIPHGWWEQPEKLDGSLWVFHPWKLSEKPDVAPLPAANLHVIDLDLDGDHDVIMSSAHKYGVWWFENTGAGKQMVFHKIDDTVSQTHALLMVDLKGNGNPHLVTGKRFWAHNGSDPGEKEPVAMLTYEIIREKGQPPKFVRREIGAGLDTGIGTQFEIRDFNADGQFDVILSNKKGVNVLLQKPKL